MDQHFIQFPTFVANQVLTPESLNQVFEYLDEQERMTRVYLTGTGIVGGLPVSVSGDGTLLTIGCGCGVTTDGFLIRTDETTYNSYAPFDFTSTDVYQPFCLPAGSTTPPYRAFPIYELYNNGNINIQDNPYVPAPSGVTTYGLTNAFLQNMVVVLLCDVNSVQAQNCNTESCDGLGVTNTVTYRALLINQASVGTVLNNVGIADNKCITPDLFYGTPDLYVNRFNVYTSSICTSGQFYDAYLQSFPQELLNNMQNAFSQMYGFIKPLVVTQYPNDPFTTFVNSYTYLYDGTIVNTDNANSLIQLQYFYDYFINLIDAYNELRDCCLEISGTCCTSNMFPRHLFLGLLTSNTTPPSQLTCQTSGVYYTGFSPSGAIAGSTMANKVVALYNRLALLYKEFLLPTVTNYTAPAKPQTDPNIRITPTISGTAPLSDKSIPFYYNMQGTSPALLNAWN